MKNYIYIILLISFWACNKQKEIPKELVDSYNLMIQNAESDSLPWVDSPVLIALELSGATKRSCETNIQIKMLNSGEKPSMVIIKIEELGVFDDSSDKSVCYFYFKRNSSDNWRVVSSKKSLGL